LRAELNSQRSITVSTNKRGSRNETTQGKIRHKKVDQLRLFTFKHQVLNLSTGLRTAFNAEALYPQKLALTSPISDGRSVGKVRSRTQVTELSYLTLKDGG
jgi:hypothetical protein